MCMKTPKPKAVKEKPVQYLRNPWLDGLAIGAGQGRNSLRVDRTGAAAPTAGGAAAPTYGGATAPGLPGLPSVPGLVIPTIPTARPAGGGGRGSRVGTRTVAY